VGVGREGCFLIFFSVSDFNFFFVSGKTIEARSALDVRTPTIG
jgi:hypothetical protein